MQLAQGVGASDNDRQIGPWGTRHDAQVCLFLSFEYQIPETVHSYSWLCYLTMTHVVTEEFTVNLFKLFKDINSDGCQCALSSDFTSTKERERETHWGGGWVMAEEEGAHIVHTVPPLVSLRQFSDEIKFWTRLCELLVQHCHLLDKAVCCTAPTDLFIQ